ncbi:putative acid phosphatase [Streptomyces sp. NBRC 110611]|uniref:histidine phosphatase family protein n=1 Tax=Streptomyces sp. NBRC 110611 TaxID=1621259 RepID=UPI0008561ED7|nr:histidine phosphatase family protein [Streptomyces sp. NBRC 110611]GAU66492.1 putative acid phosphatase [Streptomyces sp. NBRC 110611]
MPGSRPEAAGPGGCRLVLIRHGQTECTVAGRFCGAHEAELTPAGEEMARAAGTHPALHGVEAVVSSPAARARHTAEAVAGPHGAGVVVDDRLRELRFGAWENLLPGEVPEPVEHQRWERDPAYFSPPGGETGLEVMARSVAAVRDAMHGRKAVAVVTHKAPIRLVVAFFLGLPPSRYRDLGCVTVGSVSWLTVAPGGATLHGLGDSSHLPAAWRRDPDRARAATDLPAHALPR